LIPKLQTELVFLFDGTNPMRVSARHNKRTQTNLLFADGHAATFLTSTLPYPDFHLNTIMQPKYRNLRWRLDDGQ